MEMTQPTWEHLNQRFSALLDAPLDPEAAPRTLQEWVALNRMVH